MTDRDLGQRIRAYMKDPKLQALPIDARWNGTDWVGVGADIVTCFSHPDRPPGLAIKDGPGVVLLWPKRMSIFSHTDCLVEAWSVFETRAEGKQYIRIDFTTDPVCKTPQGLYIPSLMIVRISGMKPGATVVGELFRERP